MHIKKVDKMNSIILIATTAHGVQSFNSRDMASDACAYFEECGMVQVGGRFEDEIGSLTDSEFSVLELDMDSEESQQRYAEIKVTVV